MKNKSIQKNTNGETNDKQEGFVRGSEKAKYNEPLYILIPKIDMLF